MLLSTAKFFEEEKDASILLFDQGYVFDEKAKDECKTLLATAQGWVQAAGVTEALIAKEEKEYAAFKAARVALGDAVPEFENIFLRDAERTFRTKANQVSMMELLTFFQQRYGDYHQGQGLVAGFFMLTLSYAEIIAMVDMYTTDKYVGKKMWKAESIGSATDGYVFMELAKTHVNPAILATLQNHHILPETYVQKWFNGLCVHVIDFTHLFKFFTYFSEQGSEFYFRFGLSLLKTLEKHIDSATNMADVYALLRLDQANPLITTEIVGSILSEESINSFDFTSINFTTLRQQLYDTHLKERVEAAHRAHAEGENKEAGDTCQFCNEAEAEYYCADCDKAICDPCRDKPSETHDEDEHMVVGQEDKEWILEERAAEQATKEVTEQLAATTL